MVDFVWPPGSLAGQREWAQRAANERMKDDKFEAVIENEEGAW